MSNIPEKLDNKIFTNFTTENEIEMPFLVSTSNHGVLYFNGKSSKQIIKGNAYGLVKRNTNWWVFLHRNKVGSIVTFDEHNNFRLRMVDVHKSVHQIYFIEDDLFIMDTKFNRVLIYKNIENHKLLSQSDFDVGLYPNGRLDVDIKGNKLQLSDNYSHFNSIFKYGNQIYLIAHNNSVKTNKESEIYILDETYAVVDKICNIGRSCHNFYKDKTGYYVCDSLGGRLLKNGKEVFGVSSLLRGLFVGNEYILVGGSDFDPIRNNRKNNNGYIYVLDKEYNLINTITIPNCQVNDIINGEEY